MQVTRLEMDTANQPSQEPNLNALAIVPAKRKRGRPRKYPSADDPNFHPGCSKFGRRGSSGNKTHQAGPIHTAKDSRVGQFVSGVIESEFDGGYLLTVKVRNSDITLRGVVFKLGRCDLVTAENDVAPNIPMVHRNEVLRPSDGYSRVSKYRSRGRNRVSNPLLSTSLVALKNKHAAPPPVTTQAIVPFRGNVAPTVAIQAMQPSDESCQSRTLRNGREADASSPEVDVKPMKPPPGTRYGNLMREDEHSKKAAAKTGITMEAHRQQQAMFMEPFHSNAVSSPLDSERNGRMTKLLQAVQENAMKNQMH